MKIILLLCLIFCVIACKEKKNKSTINMEREELPITIQISDALLNCDKEILLSELADSISYIPLETKKECLLGNHPFFLFKHEFIAYCNYCFDWSGNFLYKVGKLGQGPGEEPSEILTNITFCNNNFYTCGQKLIEYDSLGKFTGKELSLYSVDKLKGIVSHKSLSWIVDFNSSNEKLLLYNYPDTIFVLNKDLKFESKHSVMPWEKEMTPFFLSGSGPFDRYMTNFKQDILFYNFFRDTVFQISGTQFNPKWIIKFDDIKLSDEVLYNFDKLYAEAAKDYTTNQLNDTPLSKLMDHKYLVFSVYESENYLFILASETIAFRKLRNIPSSIPILIYYNKKTKEIKSANKIKDDLSGYPSFFPKCGLVNENMIDFFWPYEQEEWLKEKAKNDPRFSSFSGRDFSEDNPIIMVVHLKK